MSSSNGVVLASALCALGAASPAFALPTIQAGAWANKVNDGPVRRVCQVMDRTFDPATITKIMAIAGAPCTVGQIRTLGSITAFSNTCQIAGGTLTTFTTINSIGPDAYSTRSQSHYAGGPQAMPDQDDTVVSKRIGPCSPGDPKSPW